MYRSQLVIVAALTALLLSAPGFSQSVNFNEPGIYEPITSAIEGRDVRIPNTDQSVDGVEQNLIEGPVAISSAFTQQSLLGHGIHQTTSPNEDMRFALQHLVEAAGEGDQTGVDDAAQELQDILLGTTEGRIYDGFSMLNFNRFKDPRIGPNHFPDDVVPGEYKMKEVRDTGRTFVSPFDGENRKIWEVDINMLYYDGQIDSDTFLVKFPFEVHEDDTLHVNYRIYSLVEEDFSPTLVMLDKRRAMNTVQFPFKGFDSVWVAFFPGEVVDLTVKYPPVRMLRGVYTWGWRLHPPRIQFLQPVFEIQNAHTGTIELGPQGESYAFRNREELTLNSIGSAAPEMKMLQVAEAALAGLDLVTLSRWLTMPDYGPYGVWYEWAGLATEQTQLPPEAWDVLAGEGHSPGDLGDFNMVSVFLNNEMYGEGPFESEVNSWDQGDKFKVKLINLDNHTHYFRNVDFGPRLHDDILRCCGGGETSFEIMNFKPSYGAPKVAEMQWRAGWGFRPHYDVIQQQGVFSRSSDRFQNRPYTDGDGDIFYGYQYSEGARGGDFRFNPPPFVITDTSHPAQYPLKDADGEAGLVIGQHTEGYGVAQMCPIDPYPGFCEADIGPYNPNGVYNWPEPANPDVPKTELRFPPFLRNPAQGATNAGDIIAPTGAWRPFLWINPSNGTLFIDPNHPEQGYWSDLTYSHGRPVWALDSIDAAIELPRASGQVFYQFDDLFHDNSIFSPHPLTEGEEEVDHFVHFNAFLDGFWRIRMWLGPNSYGHVSEFVTLHTGGADDEGCSGPAMAYGPVRPEDGFTVFRCTNKCKNPLVGLVATDMGLLPPGTEMCVETSGGAFHSFVLPETESLLSTP